jgi:predicted nucleic acid-binding protein
MRTVDKILIDTNVLVYVHQALSPFHAQSKALLEKGLREEILLCVCPQVLIEFYAVITNPKRVTNPVTSDKALIEIKKYFKSRNIYKIFPKGDTLKRTIDLIMKYKVTQMDVFDLQLVATMLSNGVKRLSTFNTGDFEKFKEIEVTTPT